VYVDDVIFVAKDPMKYIKIMEYEYQLKGVGVPEYYLGGDMEFSKDGKMSWSAKTYIKNISERIEKLFEICLKSWDSPMVADYRPELDTSPLLEGSEIAKYQMLIGCLNWIVTLGRFDVQYATSTLARYSTCPKEGHLKAALRVFGYLKAYIKARIDVDVSIPEIQGEAIEHDWVEFYQGVEEEIPLDMPPPKGKPVTLTTYVDADHASCTETRRSVTGVLLLINNTPIRWYSKRQNTVETSTYGSELVAARIATELSMELRYQLRMLGVGIQGPTIMYGDNQSVVISTTTPSSTLKKRHNALAYHRVREAVAADIISFRFIRSALNWADILTKPLAPGPFYSLLKQMLMKWKVQEELKEKKGK